MPFDGVDTLPDTSAIDQLLAGLTSKAVTYEPDTVRVLSEALRLITVNGWCQNSFAFWGIFPVKFHRRIIAPRFCSKGAIMRAGLDLDLVASVEPACNILSSLVVGRNIIKWNDARSTTKQEVITGFGCAILKARRLG